jgi:hypothetical protein
MTLKEVGIIAKGEIFNKRTAEKYLKYFFRSVELLFEQLNPHDYQITSLQRCSTLDKWVFKKNAYILHLFCNLDVEKKIQLNIHIFRVEKKNVGVEPIISETFYRVI